MDASHALSSLAEPAEQEPRGRLAILDMTGGYLGTPRGPRFRRT